MARNRLAGALTALLFASPSMSQVADSTRPTLDGRLKAEIHVMSALLRGVKVPAVDSFLLGNQEVATGTTRSMSIAVARGTLDVRGRVVGDALVLHGDLVIHPGGVITGSAVAVDGRVRTAGGIVEGEIRTLRGLTSSILAHAGAAGADGPTTTRGNLKVVFGWFTVLFVMGIGILLFAEKNLDLVVGALQRDLGRSFWTGLLAQLAALPALLLILGALCVTIIGILLVPFAIVAYVIGLAGLFALGFIAVSRFTGQVFFRGAAPSRSVSLRSLLAGLLVYLGLWFLAAAFGWNPMAGSILRAVALAGSWVALTYGLGATILTRAGTRAKSDAPPSSPKDELSWQTPTPVTGVVAARRPVASAKPG